MTTTPVRYSDNTRRKMVAGTAQPAPRSNGRKVTLTLTLYDGGHGAIHSVPRTQPMMSNNHAERMVQLDLLLREIEATIAAQDQTEPCTVAT